MRVTPRSKTLIDNIFKNGLDESSICGNLTCFISDLLAQLLINTNKPMVKNLIKKRNFIEEFSKTWIKRNLEKL